MRKVWRERQKKGDFFSVFLFEQLFCCNDFHNTEKRVV